MIAKTAIQSHRLLLVSSMETSMAKIATRTTERKSHPMRPMTNDVVNVLTW